MSGVKNYLTHYGTGSLALHKLDTLVEKLAYANDQKALRDRLEADERKRHTEAMADIAYRFPEGNYIKIAELKKDIKEASANLSNLLATRLGAL